jgi:hypothetical protein
MVTGASAAPLTGRSIWIGDQAEVKEVVVRLTEVGEGGEAMISLALPELVEVVYRLGCVGALSGLTDSPGTKGKCPCDTWWDRLSFTLSTGNLGLFKALGCQGGGHTLHGGEVLAAQRNGAPGTGEKGLLGTFDGVDHLQVGDLSWRKGRTAMRILGGQVLDGSARGLLDKVGQGLDGGDFSFLRAFKATA